MRVLVVNAGSSSTKLRVLDDDDQTVGSADLPAARGHPHEEEMADAVRTLGRIDAVGHRIVHGGSSFTEPVQIDADVRLRIASISDLAPLHQPKSLAALDSVDRVLGGVPSVACFDTAFHVHMPAAASTYALPSEWRARWGLRRYGFHGLSHAYASRRAAELSGSSSEDLRIVTSHLGAGASLCAVKGGRSVDTTMGFTPLDGLVMATRCGSIDPGLVLWLAERVGTPPSELAATLEHRSGLLGLADTDDMRVVLARADVGDPDAVLALGVYLHRVRAGIASMAASMGGLDALVFTAGVGENSPAVRQGACDALAFLGVQVDPGRNAHGSEDREISAPGCAVRTFVVEAREDLEIAREVRRVLFPGAE